MVYKHCIILQGLVYSIKKKCQSVSSKLLLGYKCRFSLLCDWRHIVHLVPHPNALPRWVQLFLLKNVLKVVQSCKMPTWLLCFSPWDIGSYSKCGSSSHFYPLKKGLRHQRFWNQWLATAIEGRRVPKEDILLSTGLGLGRKLDRWLSHPSEKYRSQFSIMTFPTELKKKQNTNQLWFFMVGERRM